ncbi:permease-like cell division protein FtsX [Colwellia sp. E2M01]|uniref:permease-like cell division protein FtsX n=1 Tax=Colwellia sp. E2M01 TaxID=2841561 RepID=UPI001C091641|nr:permease-like cell division protein FtsX [Colwellia sp. E2M01]MBU2869563.1 permease-like cell division protein FtsX [Colwellia sp. E2M01]
MSNLHRSGLHQRSSMFRRLMTLPIRHAQQAIGSLGGLWRTPFTTVMTIFVLGISLALPATLHLFIKNAEQVSEQWDSASQITLFLKLSTSEKSAQNLVKRIGLDNDVAEVKYISAEQALKEFKVLSGFGQSLEYLDKNPLPATVLVTPTQRASQAEAANDLLAKLSNEREVDQGKLDLEWLTRLEAMTRLIEDIVIGVALLLCLSVVLIVGNTIRLAILNEKDAIAIMKLVGATDSFIQRPFLYSGIWYGIFGGILSCITVTILAWYLGYAINDLSELYQSNFQLVGLNGSEALMLIVFAITLALVGSYISVNQHIKDIEPNAD